jgi:hypothetical protein
MYSSILLGVGNWSLRECVIGVCVCVIECHHTSALLVSAVLSCPAVSLCTTKSSTSSRPENLNYHSS